MKIYLNIWLNCLILCYCFWQESCFGYSTDTYTVIEDQAKVPVLTPALSEQKVLKIELKNGLKAVLISDPHLDKSAAVMSVGVGSWQNPDDHPGLAHFLEHMLFLGTKKYPLESDYQRFISEHGGTTNAFTANNYTSFMFSVDNTDFSEALDRFSNFFKEPLFNPSGVARELNAIDQEYAKNLDDDDGRLLYVMKELENPEHPNHRFTIGNSSTLGKTSKNVLENWYREHYSSNLMRLVVYSTLPLDQLRDLVVGDFKDVVNTNKKIPPYNMPIASPSLSGKIVYVQPIRNIRKLTMVWDLPQKFSKMIDTSPERIFCQIMGHEGEKSLLALLKKENLAEKLGCSAEKIGPDNLTAYIDIELTDEGVHQIDQVISYFFQLVSVLKQQEMPEYVFDEMHKMDLIHYQYQQRDDSFETVMQAATAIMEEPIETYPEKKQIIQKFNRNDVKEFLDFITPQNTQFYVTAPGYITGIKPEKKEKWVGVEYSIKEIPEEKLKEWEKITIGNENLNISPPNTFIPEDLKLTSTKQEGEIPLVPHPKILFNNESGKTYYSFDQRYHVPEVYWVIEIKTPEIEAGKPCKAVLGDLYAKSLQEALNQLSYAASLAGLNYKIDSNDNGIVITLSGYSEKAPLLYEEILKQIKELKVSEEFFEVYKQSLLRQYQNFQRESPLKQAFDQLKKILYLSYSTKKQKLVAIKKITYEKFNQFLLDVFKQNYIQSIFYGNLTEEEAKALADKTFSMIGGQPYPISKHLKPAILILPANHGPFYLEQKTQASGNAVVLAIEGNKDYSFKERAAQQILMKAMSQPFFSTLRTKQQTGYLVVSSGEEWEKQLLDLFMVQSNTHDVRDLLARFELFIEGFLQEMGKSELMEESFETIRKALLTKLQQPQNNLNDMGDLLYTLAFHYDGDFDWINKRIEALQKLTYSEFLKISQGFLGRSNKKRLAILMKGTIPDSKGFNYIPLQNGNELRQYKR